MSTRLLASAVLAAMATYLVVQEPCENTGWPRFLVLLIAPVAAALVTSYPPVNMRQYLLHAAVAVVAAVAMGFAIYASADADVCETNPASWVIAGWILPLAGVVVGAIGVYVLLRNRPAPPETGRRRR